MKADYNAMPSSSSTYNVLLTIQTISARVSIMQCSEHMIVLLLPIQYPPRLILVLATLMNCVKCREPGGAEWSSHFLHYCTQSCTVLYCTVLYSRLCLCFHGWWLWLQQAGATQKSRVILLPSSSCLLSFVTMLPCLQSDASHSLTE